MSPGSNRLGDVPRFFALSTSSGRSRRWAYISRRAALVEGSNDYSFAASVNCGQSVLARESLTYFRLGCIWPTISIIFVVAAAVPFPR